MPDLRRCVIARFSKRGRWSTVAEFTRSQVLNGDAEEYAAEMNRTAKSHTNFEVVNGDWSAAKKECAKRNRQLATVT